MNKVFSKVSLIFMKESKVNITVYLYSILYTSFKNNMFLYFFVFCKFYNTFLSNKNKN